MFGTSRFGLLLVSLLAALLGGSGQEPYNRSRSLEFGDGYRG